MKELVSRQLVKYLEHRGIEHIFGLCGHTNIAVLAELEKSSIKFINTRHEQVAGHMADGYARVTKKASVVLSHIGPGLTNTATAIGTAALDSIPMVVIAGDVPSHYYGKNAFQEVNLHSDASQFEIFRPIVKRAWRVERPELFPEIIEKAFQLAESGRRGPVLVSVPMDIFSKEIDTSLFERLKHHTKKLTKPTIDVETAEKIILTLINADNPLLYVGGGIVIADAAEEVRELVDHLNLPVANSMKGKGVVSDDHPLSLGLAGYWGSKLTNEKTKQADYILAIGTRFSEADSSSWEEEYTFNFPPTKLIHIDIDPNEIGRNYPVEIGVVADIKEALKVLNKVAKRLVPAGLSNEDLKQEIKDFKEGFTKDNEQHVKDESFPMRPERILQEVREALPKDAFITTDVGWNKNGVAQRFPIYEAGTVLTPGGFATMGFGSPAAVGVKVAKPDRVVVSLVGDGGFGQNPAVLATAAEENIGVIWVIMNNSSYGVIAGLEKAHFDTTFGTIFYKDGKPYTPDFAAMARSFGVEGIKIESAAEFKPALEKAIASNKPCVIDVSMVNVPTPTNGHWNINDIYSPNEKKSHVSVPL
ncbi:thiamine pyrophosphate-binding protein [Neobacillus sp. OS1-32]|uniref:Thiamine pyrophosphate-binding protein n=1 Tax=Neobacillus paridis TaxID=2803862 RepID=A0ABS1TUI8_9BACI|nr:thiamine pyrophosphate-binding protein [Neobacillus sp. OS1-32]MBL4954932.1 thiamine pyrophosphate-binding protein [Neobacillus paridis]WML30153.1 thiamine pyrophosphate-binding protein [Neobacillus sp. OS1-32]